MYLIFVVDTISETSATYLAKELKAPIPDAFHEELVAKLQGEEPDTLEDLLAEYGDREEIAIPADETGAVRSLEWCDLVKIGKVTFIRIGDGERLPAKALPKGVSIQHITVYN